MCYRCPSLNMIQQLNHSVVPTKTIETVCKAIFLYRKHSDIIFTHPRQPSPAWQVSLVTQCVSYLIPRVLAFTYFRSFQIPASETLISPLLHFILLSVLHPCLSRSQRSVSLFFMAHWSLKSIWSHCPPVWDLENLRGHSASLTLLLLTWVRGGGEYIFLSLITCCEKEFIRDINFYYFAHLVSLQLNAIKDQSTLNKRRVPNREAHLWLLHVKGIVPNL